MEAIGAGTWMNLAAMAVVGAVLWHGYRETGDRIERALDKIHRDLCDLRDRLDGLCDRMARPERAVEGFAGWKKASDA